MSVGHKTKMEELQDRMFLKFVGKQIRAARRELKYTRHQLAEITGIEQKAIFRFEYGLTAMTLTEFQKLAVTLSQPMGYFLETTSSQRRRERKKKLIRLEVANIADKTKKEEALALQERIDSLN